MHKISQLLGIVPFFASSAMAVVYSFGSDNDGLAGFTQSPSANPDELWTTQSGSVQYRNQYTGTLNSSLLREFILDRSDGKAYRIEGTVTLTDGYADDNNRVGMYLFGDASVVPNEDEVGAVGLIFNSDDSSAGGAPGNNASDNLTLRIGIDSPDLTASVLRNQTITPYSQDLFGTSVTFRTDIAFVGADIVINATLREQDGTETTTGVTVAAADYTGDYFGFVTRARARNYATNPTPEGRGSPWVMDYRSFSVTEIPEPATLTVVAMMGGLLLGVRRRPRR